METEIKNSGLDRNEPSEKMAGLGRIQAFILENIDTVMSWDIQGKSRSWICEELTKLSELQGDRVVVHKSALSRFLAPGNSDRLLQAVNARFERAESWLSIKIRRDQLINAASRPAQAIKLTPASRQQSPPAPTDGSVAARIGNLPKPWEPGSTTAARDLANSMTTARPRYRSVLNKPNDSDGSK